MTIPTALAWLFTPTGRIPRATFFGIGLLLVAVKVALDAALSRLLLDARGFGAASGELALSGAISAIALLCFGIEGLVCIVMAVPLWFLIASAGTALGVTAVRAGGYALPRVAPVLFVVPAGGYLEARLAPESTVFEVGTTVHMNAPAARVWQHLVAFSELAPPTELVFRLGIAYPVRASIEGSGPGAVRRCSFSTGDFVEPIEVWDEPRLLRFSVIECPQPMVEWNPFHDHVDAHHLRGFFTAKRGQFALSELPDGTTELTGTTWYSHGLWPEGYWAWWSEFLVHTIHRRVLEHVARLAEGSCPRSPRRASPKIWGSVSPTDREWRCRAATRRCRAATRTATLTNDSRPAPDV